MPDPRRELWLAACLVLAGCGSSSGHQAARTVTVPAYGTFSATTVAGAPSREACTRDADSFAEQARQLLAHFGPRSSYPADLNYVILREAAADFQARGCDPKLLGRELERRLTAKQRLTFLENVPAAMAAFVRQALRGSSRGG